MRGLRTLARFSQAAPPPDVRRGYAPPETLNTRFGLGPWYALRPKGLSPNRRHSPRIFTVADGEA
jgi:hypothetical protein